eukprot:CAMPEP_0170492084 /NCGR_PEP_ID=MMETSP0208-20121228/11640_1 /TAXON_ID=197538 /ORGANISM="Strombidium inclinatum, Strain S3" /LENGTH=140 /DNA_ID=CAMNT_0010767775 /DNA_START=8 /DNA_END=428 /DNA_ORIENTATION=-
MAGLTCRKKGAKQKHIKKANLKTKRFRRDVDQVVLEDMLPENEKKLLNQPLDEHKPGMGQHYCVHCAKYFISDIAIETHFKTKEHKKRFKTCKEIPYTMEEAMRAGGLQPAKPKFTKAIYAGKTKMADLEESKQNEDMSD